MTRFYNRLVVGGLIDRSKALKFWFNGKAYMGYAGDTLASALISNDIMEIGRSARHDRPRGIVGCGREEPNAFVLVEDPQSGTRLACATTLDLVDGLRARSIDRTPPTISWPEKVGKHNAVPARASGYGKPPGDLTELPTETRIAHCDVLIIGGGAAGLAAAKTAASTGAKVILAERAHLFGGELIWDDLTIDGLSAQQWISNTVDELAALPNVTLLLRAGVTGAFEQNLVHIVQRLEKTPGAGNAAARLGGFRLWKLRARHIIVATGATEQMMALPDNDRPGIMLASAVRQYLWRFAVLPGRQAVVVTNNDTAYRTAFDLAQIGVRVMAVVDTRESPQSALPMAVRASGIDVFPGSIVTALEGKSHVTSVTVASMDERGQPRAKGVKEFDCDLVCVSGGWNPDLDLFNESGGDIRYEESLGGFVPGDHAGPVTIAGAAAGHDITRDCIQSGYDAGQYAGESLKCGIAKMPRPPVTGEEPPTPPRALGRPHLSSSKDSAGIWIDLSADVTLDELDTAVRDNHRILEHVAARTGLFRGLDGGLGSALTTRVVLADTIELSPDDLGERAAWRMRPAPLQAYAPHDPRPRFRTLPTLQLHLNADVIFETYGDWTLPAFYARADEERTTAIRREAKALCNSVVMFDRSAEAKLEITGRDAAAFLNHLVTVDVTALETGQIAWGYVLDDAGLILDRVRIVRFEKGFLVLGSLGAGDLLNRWFEQWRQLGWNDLAVFITDMSAHWSVLSVAGPRTGEVLAKLRDGDGVPPAMTCLETGTAGIDGRIITASPLDVAEVEIHVPASAAAILCTHLKAAGADAELAPIGLEARNLAEIEAGGLPLHTAYGSRWSVIDFEPVQVLEAKQEDFIGKRMALKIAANGKTRPQLVRLEPENEDLVVPEGSLLVGSKGDGKGAQPVGYVVAGGIGPKTGHALAIGFLESGRSAVSIFVDGKIHDARVVTGASASEKAEATEEVLEHA